MPRRRPGLLIWLSTMLAAVLSLSCQQQPQPAKSIASPPSPRAVVGNGPPRYPPAIVGQPYQGTGVVKLISLKEGWIEINHEEIKGLMPAMEMEWSVTNRSLLESVSVGDKVDFTVVETGKGEYITTLKRKPVDR